MFLTQSVPIFGELSVQAAWDVYDGMTAMLFRCQYVILQPIFKNNFCFIAKIANGLNGKFSVGRI